jgi:hypothetical protein
MPAGKGELVVMVSGAVTVNENEPLLMPPAKSVTVAVKVTVPAEGGVPESSPVVLIVSQLGWPVAVQLYGDTPAVAPNCCV